MPERQATTPSSPGLDRETRNACPWLIERQQEAVAASVPMGDRPSRVNLCVYLPPARLLGTDQPISVPTWELRCAATGRQALCPADQLVLLGQLRNAFDADGVVYTAQRLVPVGAPLWIDEPQDDDGSNDPAAYGWDDEPSLSAFERNPSLCR